MRLAGVRNAANKHSSVQRALEAREHAELLLGGDEVGVHAREKRLQLEEGVAHPLPMRVHLLRRGI